MMKLMPLTGVPACTVTEPGKRGTVQLMVEKSGSIADSLVFQYSPGPGGGMFGLFGPIVPPSLMELISTA
jgi:hypothetical protein